MMASKDPILPAPDVDQAEGSHQTPEPVSLDSSLTRQEISTDPGIGTKTYQDLTCDEKKSYVEGDESEDEDDYEDVDEDYPGDYLPHPALESELGVFIDSSYDEATKKEIWNNQGLPLFNYKFALEFWTAVFDDTISLPPTSRAEANSRLLCKEWWENTGYDSEHTQAIRSWIGEAAEYELDTGVQPCVAHSTYNEAMLSLWREEYKSARYSSENIDSRPGLEKTSHLIHPFRERAASISASHRLIDAALNSIGSSRQLKFSPGNQKPMSKVPNAHIDSCYWLSDSTYSDNPPFYLWDRAARRTIRTNELKSQPSYLAVSHTWGRWETEAVDIAGVPWPVPGCEKFEVQKLPDMLASIPFPEAYVWLDLFCIPQSGDDSRKKLEIANQAAIFRSATTAIAWLPTIQSWEGVKYTIELIAMQCLSAESKLDLTTDLELCAAKAETATGLVQSWDEARKAPINRKDNLQPWFTSLWTLQELCLRPDMLLCDKEWRPLTLSGFKVPLDHIMALNMSKVWSKYLDSKSGVLLGRGIMELQLLLMDTRIVDLPELMSMTAMILADQRYCRGRRAEAIMSVVGCTKWFLEDTSDDPGNRQLVLGRYPLAFIQEVQSKMGAVFFATVDYSPLNLTDHATLMPFSSEPRDARMHARSILPHNPMLREDHPSVAHWTIDATGAVLLRQVGIVASYPRRENSPDIYVDLLGFAPIALGLEGSLADVDRDEKVELHGFLASFCPDKEKQAVHLMRSGSTLIFGIILLQELGGDLNGMVPGASWDPEAIMFGKLCNFQYSPTQEESYAVVENVEWVVL